MLWTCLLLPSLPLDVFARAQTPADTARPFAVTTGGHYPRIVAANAAASDAGVRAGQLVSAALALAPDLVLRDRDPNTEAAGLAAKFCVELAKRRTDGAAYRNHDTGAHGAGSLDRTVLFENPLSFRGDAVSLPPPLPLCQGGQRGKLGPLKDALF